MKMSSRLLLLWSILTLSVTGAMPCLATAARAEDAFAPSDYVTLGELRNQALAGWHQTYTAMGREVTVNADIDWMPETDTCAILQIEGLGEKQLDAAALAPYQGIRGVETFLAEASLSVDYIVQSPGTGSGEYYGKVLYDQPYQTYTARQLPPEQPENVDLTYDQLLNRIDNEIRPFFGLSLEDFRISEVSVNGVEYKARTNQQGELIKGAALTTCGAFGLTARQLFRGIPVVGHSGSYPETPKGELKYYYACADYYHFTLSCSREKAVHTPDVPLLSFEALKRVLEGWIESGHLRGVDKLEFGYMAFYQGSRDSGDWLLMPVWHMLGGYTNDPGRERVMPYYDEKEGFEMLPEEYNDYYFSAQTGQLLPTDGVLLNGKLDNPLPASSLLTWQELGQ